MKDMDGNEISRLPDDCNIELNIECGTTQNFYETYRHFVDRFEVIASNQQIRDAKFHVSTLLLGVLKPSTSSNVFGGIRYARMLEKCLFNIFTILKRSEKLTYA